MTTEAFLDLLDRRQLVSRNVVRQLRAKAEQDGRRITPESILKYLVKKDLISRRDAKKLLQTKLTVSTKAESSIMGEATQPTPGRAKKAPPKSNNADLGLAPIDDDTEEKAPPPRKAAPTEPQEEQQVEVVPVQPAAPEPAAVAAEPMSSPSHDLESAEADDLGDTATRSSSYAGKSKNKKKKKKRSRRKERNKNEWDSPLLLIGGGGLLVLLITGVLLYYLLFRENADQKLKAAADLYAGGSYTQAIKSYQDIVENFPNHPEASDARVRLDLARLYEATNGSSAAEALDMAKTIIVNIEDEPAYAAGDESNNGISEAKREFSELLTQIIERLANEAEQADDAETSRSRIAAAREAIGLTNNTKYVPHALRAGEQINDARELLNLVERRLERESDLSATLAEMDAAIAGGDAARAYESRKQLLQKHPALESNPDLTEKVKLVSQAEKANVRFISESRPATTEPRESNVVASLAVASRSGAAAPGVEGNFAVRIDGVLYGFAASDGSLLWRRYVGASPSAYPLLLPGGRLIVSDVDVKELVCLDAREGKLLWRQPLGDVVSEPVLAGDKILAAGDSGKLFVLDAETGKLAGHVAFGQPIRVPPTASPDGERIYVVGEHSNLYTLAASDLSCIGVYYLGHRKGAVAAPPAALADLVIVAVNAGAETCNIQALATDDQGAVASIASESRMSGLVRTSLVAQGRRIAAVTTLGAAKVFEIGVADGRSVFNLLASREARRQRQLAHFALMTSGNRESNLWIAGRQLAKLAILPTSDRMPVRSIQAVYSGDVFDYPLQSIENLVIHVRRPSSSAGVAVAAVDAANGRPVWETLFAAPAADAATVDADGRNLAALTSAGSAVTVNGAAWTDHRVAEKYDARGNSAAGGDDSAAMLTTALQLPDGGLIGGAVGADKLRLYRPTDNPDSIHFVQLPGPLTCPLVRWRDGFVAPTSPGQVVYLDADGASLARPFQPPLSPEAQLRWLKPAAFEQAGQSWLAVSDGKTIYLLQRQKGVRPFLAAVETLRLEDYRLATPLAVIGDQLVAGTDGGALARFALPDLAPQEPSDLGSDVVWGPFAAGEGVLLATADGELMLVDQQGRATWHTTPEWGVPAGVPLAAQNDAWVLFPTSRIAAISLTDGAAATVAEVRQPAVHGPVRWGDGLLLTATDGAYLAVRRP